jgi:predicted transposase YbfD/YdcC
MAASNVGSFKKYFAPIKDPRVRGRTRHRLIDILVIAICAVIADCDDWQSIVLFAKQRETWFKRFLSLPNGIPSHDTFERVFTKIHARAFQDCCLQWLKDVSGLMGVKHMAIDGKTLRGSKRRTHSALHLVSAWATEAGMTLGQLAVDGKSNEITAIPKLLELLDVKGALVSIDAIGCQKAIAAQIVEGGGDYLLAVKGNQEHLLADIQATVTKALDGLLPTGTVEEFTTRSVNHGREENRWCMVIQNLEEIRDRDAWKNLRSLVMCSYESEEKGRTTAEVRYFISSRKLAARKCAEGLRGHWQIENGLHWQLDVSFGEDASRISDRQRAEGFAMLRKVGLCLLAQHPEEISIAKKRQKAALNPEFLAEVIAGVDKVARV